MVWIQTHTGRKVDPTNVQPEDLDIRDIAHALSHICRFGGHAKGFYSVAQHCVIAARALSSAYTDDEAARIHDSGLEDRKWALLHDAGEAYYGDIVRPLKRSLYAVSEWEVKVFRAIRARFGLLGDMPEVVRRMDHRLLFTEKRDVLAVQLDWDDFTAEPLETRIDELWTPEVARLQFLGEFELLWGRLETRLGEPVIASAGKVPCCERDHDRDGNCDRHPERKAVPLAT